ncbi:MAG: Bcep22 3 [Alphaproteobacteria bacterium]|nr:Bcep22 3 [Alphaproteobacteria bacterium]
MNAIDDAIARHERIALQVSGGRDSLACLYLLRPHWSKLTVYWCNTGDPFPETEAIMRGVRAIVPQFVEIAGNQPGVVAGFGLPSDIVPADSTTIGVVANGGGQLIQDRYSCCARTYIVPMHERMVLDGITLVIRGQKQADQLKAPVRSGAVDLGIEYLFPIEDWSTQQVMDYLREQDAPILRFYEMLDGAPDCMTCSAYWENGAAKYLKRYHPEHHVEVQRRLDIINAAVAPSIAHFNREIS